MENTNNKIIQNAPAPGNECIVLELPKEDIKFLYKLFDIYCDELGGEFYPDI